MQQYNLTSIEVDLAVLIFMAQDEEGHPEYLYRWYKCHGRDTLIEALKALKDKDVIKKAYKLPDGQEFRVNDIEFSHNFTKNYIKHSGQMGAELWEAYPSQAIINGKAISLKNIIKEQTGYRSLDDFFFAYAKSIKFNPEKHKEVIDITQRANKAGLINEGILSYVGNKRWDILANEFDNGVLDYGTDITFE